MIKSSLIRHLQGTLHLWAALYGPEPTRGSLRRGCDSFVCISFICKFKNRFKGRKWVKWVANEDKPHCCTHLRRLWYQFETIPWKTFARISVTLACLISTSNRTALRSIEWLIRCCWRILETMCDNFNILETICANSVISILKLSPTSSC